MRYIQIAILCCWWLAGTSCIRDKNPLGEKDLMPGDILPEFCITINDGSTICTSDLKGRVSLIMFFHTNCPDCIQELPVIQKVYDQFGDQIALICISREESASSIGAYWQENSLTLPYSAQETRHIYNLFATTGVPRVFISSGDLVIYSTYDDSPVATFEELAADINACQQRQ